MNWIKNHINKDFQLLAGTLNSVEAVKLVTDDKYGVILDEHSKPVALVTADDLTQAVSQGISSLLDIRVGFPPTIFIIGYQVDRQDLVNLKSFTERYKKIKGIIVINNNTVVGILPITAVISNLTNDDYELRGDRGALGDTELPGRHQSSNMTIVCSECGFGNQLFYIFNDDLPDCQNPDKPLHKFKPS
ncbi:hypothetical protein RIVM261_041550 [Rivularia sp. IAM M-261]|nr:hypothetical protein RIVM261_041550 [Rivularia sp. IAM M-261]